jgi:peroxiredoxin
MSVNIGNIAPDFALLDAEKKTHTLRSLAGSKVIIAFFPGVFTGVCTKEMCRLNDSMGMLQKADAQILGISVDPIYAQKAFASTNKLTFPILSDYTRYVALEYCGLVNDFGGMPGFTASKRAVYVLDRDQKVTYVWIGENPGLEPPYDDVFAAVNAIK